MESNLGRLVTFRTVEDYEIIGMLFANEEQRTDTIIIHIHGNFGNFYQNKFLWVMSNIYVANRIDFLTINLSSHDGLAEGYFGRELKYVGGGVALYDESQADIAAAIKFVETRGYKKIILQGHSLGCDKIIQYTVNNGTPNPLILLSPVDSYKVQSDWIQPELISHQVERLKRKIRDTGKEWGSADLDWLPSTEYGAKGDTAEWTYQIPITREALISILEGAAFKYLNLDAGNSFSLSNPTFAFVGKRDGLQMHDKKDWANFLRKSFTQIEVFNDLDADHDVVGVESEVAEKIVQWIMKL